MITLISYDVRNPRRLKKLHKFLTAYGINTQKSVFECEIDTAQIAEIREYCFSNLKVKQDSVRIYRICANCANRVDMLGIGIKVTNQRFAIV